MILKCFSCRSISRKYKNPIPIYLIYPFNSVSDFQVARRRIRNKPGGGIGSSVAPTKDKVTSRNVSVKSTSKKNPQLTIDTSGGTTMDTHGERVVVVSTIARLKRNLFARKNNVQLEVSMNTGSKLNVPRSPPGIKVRKPSNDIVRSPSGQLSPPMNQLSPTDGKFDSLETTDGQLDVPGASSGIDVQMPSGTTDSDKISIVSSESRTDLRQDNKTNGDNKNKRNKNNRGSGKVSKNGGNQVQLPKIKSKSDMAKEKERKTARILGIITGCFLVCWLPFFSVTTLNTLCKDSCEITNPIVLSVLLWLGYCNSMLNPIIYTIFSPDFRSAFKKMVECKRTPGYG